MSLVYGKSCLFLAVVGLLILSQAAAAQRIVSANSPTDESIASQSLTQKPSIESAVAPADGGAADDSISKPPTTENHVSTVESPPVKDFKYQFRRVETNERNLDPAAASDDDLKKSLDTAANEPRYIRETAPGRGFNYRGAFTQSLLFLAVQHGYATTQPKTRDALKHGAFWRDYAQSVKNLHGWDDGGRFFTNYLAHPMQGAFTGHVYVQNSPQALREQFSMSPQYWKTRMKALLWTTAWSTQFEIGPISQASIGNVGLKGKQTYEDIVVTPLAGTSMLIAEDAIDRYFIKAIERNNSNLYVKIFARMLLNPTRNFSNMLRFREPWYRDRPEAR